MQSTQSPSMRQNRYRQRRRCLASEGNFRQKTPPKQRNFRAYRGLRDYCPPLVSLNSNPFRSKRDEIFRVQFSRVVHVTRARHATIEPDTLKPIRTKRNALIKNSKLFARERASERLYQGTSFPSHFHTWPPYRFEQCCTKT